ncbi:MAG: hypothetical protein AB1500_12655 [Bacillota bacterium]
MQRTLNTRKRSYAISIALILFAVALALLAPEEQTLGRYIRLIYIHAAVTWVGLSMFGLSGVFAFLSFFAGLRPDKAKGQNLKDILTDLSSAGQSTAVLFWAASVALGSVAAYLTWGGNWWIEPRIKLAVFILILALFIYQLRQMTGKSSLLAGLNFGLPLSILLLLSVTGKLVHPHNAFAQSDSVRMKLFAALITLLFVSAAANCLYLFFSRQRLRRV